MIVVDTSALIAILKSEPESTAFSRAMNAADRLLIGAPTKFEFLMVATGAIADPGGSDDAREILSRLQVEVVSWTDHLADIATAAFVRFGKGRHPARLNFGDCMAYAVAKALHAPLLFKGDDFALTDVKRVTG